MFSEKKGVTGLNVQVGEHLKGNGKRSGGRYLQSFVHAHTASGGGEGGDLLGKNLTLKAFTFKPGKKGNQSK